MSGFVDGILGTLSIIFYQPRVTSETILTELTEPTTIQRMYSGITTPLFFSFQDIEH